MASWSLLGAGAALALGLFGAVRCIDGDVLVGYVALIGSALVLRVTPGVWAIGFEGQRGRGSALALLATAAALLFFRFYRMEPPGLWGDDALNGLLAYDVLDGKVSSPFAIVRHSHSLFHALTNYVIAGSFALFGADLAALRLPGIAASCAAGLSIYGITRRLFGQPAAIIAGLLFAAAPMQIAHAKSLTQVVLGLAFQTAAVYALLRAVQERAAGWLIGAALPLAATVYTYHAAKIAPLVALPVLIAGVRGGAFGHRAVAGAGLVFALCLVPAAVSFWNEPLALFGRAQAVSIFDELRRDGGARPLLISAARTLGVFHVEQGPQYNWFGPGDDPALTPVMGALVLHGLLASIVGWRRPAHQLLLFWFALGLAPAVLSTEAPRGYRTLMATPPLFVWAALPLAALWRLGRGTGRALAASALVIALVATSLIVDFHYYFHRAYTHPHSRWTLGERIVEMARIARRRGPGWTGYVMSPTFAAGHESLRLLARMWDLDLRDAPSIHFALDVAPLPDRGAVFLTVPGSHEAGAILRRQLPGTDLESRHDPATDMWPWGGSWPYETPPPRLIAVAAGVVAPRDSLDRYRAAARRLPVEVSCDGEAGSTVWREAAPFYAFFADTFAQPSRCRWRAAVRVPPPAARELHFTAGQRLEVTVDGKPYREPAPLAPGRHDVTIATTAATRRIALAVRWSKPGGGIEIVPPLAWRPPVPGAQRRRAAEARRSAGRQRGR